VFFYCDCLFCDCLYNGTAKSEKNMGCVTATVKWVFDAQNSEQGSIGNIFIFPGRSCYRFVDETSKAEGLLWHVIRHVSIVAYPVLALLALLGRSLNLVCIPLALIWNFTTNIVPTLSGESPGAEAENRFWIKHPNLRADVRERIYNTLFQCGLKARFVGNVYIDRISTIAFFLNREFRDQALSGGQEQCFYAPSYYVAFGGCKKHGHYIQNPDRQWLHKEGLPPVFETKDQYILFDFDVVDPRTYQTKLDPPWVNGEVITNLVP
jgi:hypothetical protein